MSHLWKAGKYGSMFLGKTKIIWMKEQDEVFCLSMLAEYGMMCYETLLIFITCFHHSELRGGNIQTYLFKIILFIK